MSAEHRDEHNKDQQVAVTSEEDRLEHLAMTARLQKVVSALANHGIAARGMGGIFVRLDVAEHLVSILEDLKAIEERGAV